jgi:hypothetical protein
MATVSPTSGTGLVTITASGPHRCSSAAARFVGRQGVGETSRPTAIPSMVPPTRPARASPTAGGNPTIPPSATMTMLAGTGSSASPTSRPTATAAESGGGEDSHGTPPASATR